jgi:predicted acyltransferase
MLSMQSSVSTRKNDRLLSLDVFRGIVIAAMILVTDPGSYNYTWHQLRHATWAALPPLT